MAVLPLSMSLIFRLLIFSTIVTLISHLYYDYGDILRPEDSVISLYLYRKRLLDLIITSLVIVHHLGR